MKEVTITFYADEFFDKLEKYRKLNIEFFRNHNEMNQENFFQNAESDMLIRCAVNDAIQYMKNLMKGNIDEICM